MDTSSTVQASADRLVAAVTTGRPCPPVRDLLGEQDLKLAYAVQSYNVRLQVAAGNVVIGRKIGLTSPAVQQQLGVDQPDFGFLLRDMRVPDKGTVPAGRLLQPKVEGEVAFRIGADLTGDLASVEDIRGGVQSAAAAIEIVDSRIAGWDISIVDTIADNASSGMFVTADRWLPLAEFEPAAVRMRLTLNGRVVSSGTGSACLGDPLNAVLWLARTAQRLGAPLRAGEVVLSGALGPMVEVAPGDVARAEISELGVVAVGFAQEED